MIPFAVCNACWILEQRELELSILEVSEEFFTTRLTKKYSDAMKTEEKKLQLHFWCFQRASYKMVELQTSQAECIERSPWFDVWKIFVPEENTAYREAVREFTREYLTYIRLYMEEEDQSLAEALVSYPASEDHVFYRSLEEMKKELSTSAPIREKWPVSQGIVVENPKQYDAFCRYGYHGYIQWYGKQAGLKQLPFRPEDITWIYIGNQVCDQLLPAEEQMLQMLKICRESKKKPVFVLPPVKENRTEEILERLSSLEREACFSLEIVVNDWGMMDLLSCREAFSLTAGILLLKQKKDPRVRWKNGNEGWNAADLQYGWMKEEFRIFMRERFHCRRYSVESCKKAMNLPQEAVTLYAPWFQMNTATLCPLHAAVTSGDRGKQEEADHCGRECMEWTFLYPKHLSMCGRYNSIWGYDPEAITDYIRQGADRLVWNF